MLAYWNGNLVDKEEIRLSPDDRGFLFADAIYDYIMSYQGRLFRLDDHIQRLGYGARQLRYQQADFSALADVAAELIERNGLAEADASVYFQVTRGAAPRKHAFPSPAPELAVYGCVAVVDLAGNRNKQQAGIAAITVADTRWTRCDIKTTSLTANVLANQRAHEADCGEAIFVRDGVLLEGTHSNFMAVIDGVLTTFPLSNYILGGITRKVVLEICRREGIAWAERPVFELDALRASEMLVTGSSTEITPIISLDGRPVGNGQPGPVCRRLQQLFLREIEATGRA